LAERTERLDHPDTFFRGQTIYAVYQGSRYKLAMDSEGVERKIFIPFHPPIYNKSIGGRRRWSEATTPCSSDTEVKTSRTSVLEGATRKSKQHRKKITHSGFGIHVGLENVLKERDRVKLGLRPDDYDSMADDPLNKFCPGYMPPVQRYNIIQTRGRRVLWGGRGQQQPVDLILQANVDDGTYATIDLDREIYLILNKFPKTITKKQWKKKMWKISTTTELSLTKASFAYTAAAFGGDFRSSGGFKPAVPGQWNAFGKLVL
jgi:hypothetical protein